MRVSTSFFALATIMATVSASAQQADVSARSAPFITVDGLKFRDLNRDGQLNPYEDWRKGPEARADDLVARMTLAEKAGQMLHGTLRGSGSGAMAVLGRAAGYDLDSARVMIIDKGITSFITRLSIAPHDMAVQNNAIQALAEQGRLGIPATISTDPRNHFQYVVGASSDVSGFSQWPEPLGFAALRDPALVRRFADIARGEYRAVGIQQALSPTADVASEPRWSRGTSTFGSNPELSRSMVNAYVAGFQGGDVGLTHNGVFAVVKHFAGYGALPGGFDSHNYYGRVAKHTPQSFAQHLIPFTGAFAAHVAGVMPTYPIIDGARVNGRPVRLVGAGSNKQLLTELLRGHYGFDGVILSDWLIMSDCNAECRNPTKPQTPADLGMPWGVESLTEVERFAQGINAGLDQIGGSEKREMILAAVSKGLVSEARITQSARRVLITKFRLGLFENPFVDEASTASNVGTAASMTEALRAQAESQVLLRNQNHTLPLAAGRKVYLVGVDPAKAAARGLIIVDDPAKADAALVRADTPSEIVHPFNFFGSRQHEGRLDFRPGEAGYDKVKALYGKTPVILSVFLDRPAVMTQILPMTSAILANFGVSDDALLDVVTGKVRARGRLPFELPSSMAAVEAQNPAVSDDSKAPLFRYGAGM